MPGYQKLLRWAQPSQKKNIYYAAVHSEENAAQDKANLLSEDGMTRPRSTHRKHWFILYTILFISFIFAISSLLVAFTRHYTILRRNTVSVSLPYGNPIPLMPLETKKFGPSEIFTERSSPRSNAAWEALAGPNHENPGFIYIPNWEELKLPPGGVIRGEMMYGISMFHQLHCLGAIRHTFWQLMEGRLDLETLEALDGDTTDPSFIPNGHGLWHIEHCFNYVRHALQCYGDTTIEVPTDFNGQLIFIGWNTTHQCRSFDAIWDYTVKHSNLDRWD